MNDSYQDEGLVPNVLPEYLEENSLEGATTGRDEVVTGDLTYSSDTIYAPKEVPPDSQSVLEKVGGFVKRRKVALAVGAATIVSTITTAVDPLGSTLHEIGEVAPWVLTGMGVAEVGWLGGAALMLAAIGKKIHNPFKIRSEMEGIADHAGNSTLFKSGLVVNTASALAEFIIPTIGVVETLPFKSWGILGFSLLDLAATVVVRKSIIGGMKNSS